MRLEVRLEKITGAVESVRILKGTWGSIRVEGAAAAVTGDVLGISVGDYIEAHGTGDTHPRWGPQFRASSIRRTVPADSRGTVIWLAGRFPGVGKKRAALLVESFGVKGLFEVIQAAPEKLCSVPGITEKLAREIQAEYLSCGAEQEEQTQLLGWGLTHAQIKRCREVFGNDVVSSLKADPYRLCEDVAGFGWVRADGVAMKMGLAANHPTRIRACALHVLRTAEQSGHCYLRANALDECVLELLDGATSRFFVRAEVTRLAEDNHVVVESVDGGDGIVFLAATYRLESELAAMAMEGAQWT